jgi:hypothetical protein
MCRLSTAADVAASCLHERYFSFMQGGRPRHRCRDCGIELTEDEPPAAVAETTSTDPSAALTVPDHSLARDAAEEGTPAADASPPAEPCVVSARAAAVKAIREGFAPVPIPAREKNPGFSGWQNTRLTEADVPARVADDGNLGIILGAPSRNAQDVDLDCDEALRLADGFLPVTGREHGRPSAPRSHRWYVSDEPGAVVRFKDPDNKSETLVELRGSGGQTVIPPSVHPSGERLMWEKDGEPAAVPLAELHPAVARLAAACLLARRYPEANRQDFTLALAGFLLRRAMPAPDVEALLLAVARSIPGAARPEDVRHIKRNVADTAKKISAGKKTTGGKTLTEFLSDRAMDKLTEWLGLSDAAVLEGDREDDAPSDAEEGAEPAHSQESVEETTSEPKFPDPLAREAFYGLAGEFVRLVSPHTEADEAALLAHFVVYFGNAVGRDAFFRVGATRHTAAENVAFVGVTGSGRKGTAEHETRRPFLLAEDPWVARITTGLSTGEGLIHAVRDAIEKREPIRERGRVTGYENVIADDGVQDKRLCVVESELGRVLRVMERDGNTLSATIREAWDAREVLRTLTKSSPSVATGAHVSIIGHITRDELLRYLDRTETANGFGNRFFWVAVSRSKFLPDGGTLRDEDLVSFVSKLRDALATARNVREMARDAKASAAWHGVYEALETGRTGLFGAITGRAAPHVLRLSMIYALMDGSAVIQEPHLAAGLALWTYSEDSARFVFGDATGDPEADTIADALRTAPRLSREAISNLFSRHVPAQRIAAALKLLARLGKAHTVKQATGGRPVEFWMRGTSRREESAESAKSPSDTAEDPPFPRLDRFPRNEART